MCVYIHAGEEDEKLCAVRMKMKYCFVDSCFDSTEFGETVVGKQVHHKGLEYHNLACKSPVENDSIDDIHARRVEPLGDKSDLKDPYRGYCRR